MRTGLTKQEKTTDIWFDEKDPLIHIRTHNTDLKNRLTAPYREERRRAASEAAKKNGVCGTGRSVTKICYNFLRKF